MMSHLRLYQLLLLACLSTVTPILGFSLWSAKDAGRTDAALQEHKASDIFSPLPRRSALLLIGGLLPVLTTSPQISNAGFFGGGDDNRRDLALCLVNLVRVQYWAESMSYEFGEYASDEERSKKLYLEARLGAKAAVTDKIGGGATNRVYNIGALKFRESIDDLTWHVTKGKANDKKKAIQLAEDLIESLASLVEFDGLETTQDPSPRSSLMLSMYDNKKLGFVRRMLAERIIPTAQSLFDEFEPNVREISLNYVKSTYSNEIPKSRRKPVVEVVATEESEATAT